MGVTTFFAENPLDRKRHQTGIKLHVSNVMPVEDQTSGFSTSARHHVELEATDHSIIKTL
jgi:hypothetical protein